MKLAGNLIKGTKIIRRASFEKEDQSISFHDMLEESLLALCKELDIPVPIWMKKNTGEFAMFRRTFFTSEQFTEKVGFDRFEIRME
ncbi:MAG TPA: hypothetical protein PK733_07495 [Clostridiales bacterium]|nr:hypothetical protein [Clostridiales bacterium]